MISLRSNPLQKTGDKCKSFGSSNEFDVLVKVEEDNKRILASIIMGPKSVGPHTPLDKELTLPIIESSHKSVTNFELQSVGSKVDDEFY